MKVFCEDSVLIETGRVCCFDNKGITLVFEIGEDASLLSIIIKFDYDDKGLRYSIKSPENGTIELMLYNFINPLGSGLKAPIEIAKYKGKRVFFVFYVYKLNDSNPVIDFSLYLEK